MFIDNREAARSQNSVGERFCESMRLRSFSESRVAMVCSFSVSCHKTIVAPNFVDMCS